jgi:hypothetical protein
VDSATNEAPDDHGHYGVNFGSTGRSPKQDVDVCYSGRRTTLSEHTTQGEMRSESVGAGGCDRRGWAERRVLGRCAKVFQVNKAPRREFELRYVDDKSRW